jgi:hypothetical protein
MSTRTFSLAAWVFATAWLGAPPAHAQGPVRTAAAAEKPTFSVPRTSWGDPDLSGVWDYRTITPLERRPELGDREFYTDEEVAQLEGSAESRLSRPADESTPPNLVHAQYLTDPGSNVDEAHRTSLIIDPPNGQLPPLTVEGQRRRAQAEAARKDEPSGGRADSYTDRTLYERCITRGPGVLLPTLYNNNIRISQAPSYVAIVHEMVHEARIVPLDGTPFSGQQAYLGESRGHWEGDTLVVETRNFNGDASYRGSDANLRITERYTRTGPNAIDYRVTFNDSTQWTQPWTAAFFMRPADGELYEYACHEGNYGLRNILENARDADKAAAAKKH